MANKQKKKRNKVYRGEEASTNRPSITRVSAVKRSPIKQWWVDHKRIAKPVIIAIAVIAGIIWLTVELFRIANA